MKLLRNVEDFESAISAWHLVLSESGDVVQTSSRLKVKIMTIQTYLFVLEWRLN